ncbi:MAG TPA: TraB/GumN family protein [Devosia sp.]|nr:TraB/GumN family protein [Devosia sp.]
MSACLRSRVRSWIAAAATVIALTVPAGAAPALWKVSDANSSIWLFGSIHVLPPGIAWRTPALDDLMAKAETVYFEADIGPLGQLGLVLKGLQMSFTAHRAWVDRLDSEQRSKLDAAISALGLAPAQIQGFEPWLAEAVIEDKVLETHGYLPALGVDPTLQAELPRERKAYFETAGEQMDLLAKAPLDDQIARLMAAVDDIPNMAGDLHDMAVSWSAGRVEELGVQISDDPTMDENFTRTMVRDRNARWVGVMEGLLASDRQDLVVVGAGHLAGDGSVIDLLRKAGFTIERIQ